MIKKTIIAVCAVASIALVGCGESYLPLDNDSVLVQDKDGKIDRHNIQDACFKGLAVNDPEPTLVSRPVNGFSKGNNGQAVVVNCHLDR